MENNNENLSSLVALPVPTNKSSEENSAFDFAKLKLIEQPDSLLNSHDLPQTLESCDGYLDKLPLKQPNVDQRNPQTIADMINILTNPDAVEAFEQAMEEKNKAINDNNNSNDEGGEEDNGTSNNNNNVFDYNSSDIMIEQLSTSNRDASHIELCFVFGWIVRPGCISLYNKDGKTYAVSEGRWMLTPFRGNWIWGAWNINLNQDIIQPAGSQVLIVRVLTGEVGMVAEQGTARLLDVGTHVFNSGTVKLIRKLRYADGNFFCHGPYNYLRVPRGKYAKVWANVTSTTGVQQDGGIAASTSLVPRLLKEGEHCVNSVLFKFDGFVDANEQYIQHGSVHMISVPKGFVAKVFQDNKPRLLGEGTHVIESTQCEYVGMESIIATPCIVHGTITILRVTRGEVALAWNQNEPIFIDQPGLYEFDSADFRFVEFKQAGERLISLGSKKIIQVYTGEVGITYEQGELRILDNGRHVIDSSTHIFECFLSTKQRSIRLKTLNDKERKKHMEGHSSSSSSSSRRKKDAGKKAIADEWDDEAADYIVCDTRDLVKIGCRADVFYSITDPEKCIKNIDPAELEDLVRETAVATLTNIIRSTALNQIAQSEHVSAHGNGDNSNPASSTTTFSVGGQVAAMKPAQLVSNVPPTSAMAGNESGKATATTSPPPPPSAPMFFERAHDEFMNKLHDDFQQRYGVDIVNIRMESMKIMDDELSYQISKQALTTAQVENELANLDGQSLILTQKERTAAEVQNINADAEAKASKTRMDAENQRKIEAAEAEAEALKIAQKAKAEAESAAILMKAEANAKAAKAEAESLKIAIKAEADAVLMKAEAEAEAIRMKAAAESERAEVISKTKFGQQECLLGIYSEMVKQSNSGVEKVVYLDPSVNRQSPFALGSLDNLNRDLHSLSLMGIAGGNADAANDAVNGGSFVEVDDGEEKKE